MRYRPEPLFDTLRMGYGSLRDVLKPDAEDRHSDPIAVRAAPVRKWEACTTSNDLPGSRGDTEAVVDRQLSPVEDWPSKYHPLEPRQLRE